MSKKQIKLEKIGIKNFNQFLKNANNLISKLENTELPQKEIETKTKLRAFLKSFII